MNQAVNDVEKTLCFSGDNAPKVSQGVAECDRQATAHGGAGGGAKPVGDSMARGLHLLTARFTTTVTNPGKYSDGGGLYLVVRQRSAAIERAWMFRYKRGGRGAEVERTLGFGNVRDVPLARARELARTCREAIAAGGDPKAAIGRAAGQGPTFGAVADDLISSLEPSFKSEATKANWHRTLGDMYCAGLRKRPIDEVSTEDILETLKPVWLLKPETANQIRERIERVLDAAKAAGQRSGENPARWKGHLKFLLPAQTAKRGHHRALPYDQMPEFMARLRDLDSVSALALEWTILTAARTGETLGASRAEIDRKSQIWTVPAERMKEGREHRVPLPDRCIEIFDEMEKFSNKLLFPARDPRHPLSNMAMMTCLRRLNVDATVHGFRSSFRDWAGDMTEFPREIVEAALSHQIGDEAERAYRRSDALERRRKLMTAWERYCRGEENVVAFTSTKSASR